jgi:hypothetical protein
LPTKVQEKFWRSVRALIGGIRGIFDRLISTLIDRPSQIASLLTENIRVDSWVK